MRQANGNRCDYFRVGVVRVEGQWVTPTDLKVDMVARQDGLEEADHVLVSEAQNELVIHSN